MINKTNILEFLSPTNRKITSSSATVSIWTISGILLAACSTKSKNASSGDPGAVVSAIDGPILGAALYFDINGDGEVSMAERTHRDNVDASGNPLHVTGANGQATVPREFENRAFIAVVTGAIDTTTGETLVGEYQSLESGGIATPLTDLIRQKHEEETDESVTEEDTAEEVLREVFGEDGTGTLNVNLDDIKTITNYGVLADDGTIAFDISQAAVAITEIKKADADNDLDSVGVATADPDDIIDALKAPHADLTAKINAREAAAVAVAGGQPTAIPADAVSIAQKGTLTVGDYEGGAQALFGFLDINSNADSDAPSAFTGIFIKLVIADATLTIDGMAVDADVLDEGETVIDPAIEALRPTGGYIYISASRLAELEISPTEDSFTSVESGRGTRDIEVEYYVFDGEELSKEATLSITVNDVNESPVLTLSTTVLTPPETIITISAEDPDTATLGRVRYSYSLPTAVEGTDNADNDRFTIHSTRGTLTLREGMRKNGDETYEISIQLLDRTAGQIVISTHEFVITEANIHIDDDGTDAYTGYEDGLIDENSGATDIGVLRLDGSDNVFSFDANGDLLTITDFTITQSGGFSTLRYTGTDFGDAVDDDGMPREIMLYVGGKAYTYVIHARDISDQDPVFTSDDTETIEEDAEILATVAVYTPEATPDVEGATVIYEITGGADAALFEVNEEGEVVFKPALSATERTPDFETNNDGYEIIITAYTDKDTSNERTVVQTVVIAITDGNDAPSITGTVITASVADDATGTIPSIRFTIADMDAGSIADNIDLGNIPSLFTVTIADANPSPDDDASKFEVVLISGTAAGGDLLFGIALKTGETLGSADSGPEPEYALAIFYDDQSGDDNAVSLVHEVTVDVM